MLKFIFYFSRKSCYQGFNPNQKYGKTGDFWWLRRQIFVTLSAIGIFAFFVRGWIAGFWLEEGSWNAGYRQKTIIGNRGQYYALIAFEAHYFKFVTRSSA